jgi:DNA-binding SARP family transcriptional activator
VVTADVVADVLASLPADAGPQAAATAGRASSEETGLPADQSSAAAQEAPRVLLLGPVRIEGADDDAVPNRRRRLTELVAYLALHPGATYHQLDEALWPGKRVPTDTRNATVSRARRWLGNTPDGDPYLPTVAAEGDYRLHPAVGCDWHDLARLARRGLRAGPDGPADLAAALDLVRGRPFLGVDPRDYGWAEVDIQQMIGTIVDVAHVLSNQRLQAGDGRGAQDAATRGLLAEPCSELLHRDAIRAAAARGDKADVTRIVERLQSQLEHLDPDGGPEDETIELLDRLGFLRSP